jgi:hypothetical protein
MVRLEHKLAEPDREEEAAVGQERKHVTFVELDEAELPPVQKQETPKPEPRQALQPQELPLPPPVPQPQPVVQTVVVPDENAARLAKILGDFSFEAMRSEISHRFEELRKDLAVEKAAPAEPATSVSFQIETAKIPAQEAEPAKQAPDYSSMILPEEEAPEEEKQESTGGVDIMALLAAQAKKMENISAIEMMSVYGEAYTEVTLEELEKYINKNCR